MTSHLRFCCPVAFVILAVVMPYRAYAEDFPTRLSVVLQIDDQWQLYIVKDSSQSLTAIATVSEPRTPTVCWSQQRIAYVSATGALREIDLKISDDSRDRILLSPSADVGFTQPLYSSGCDSLYFVELKQGKSVDTDIVQLSSDEQTPIVTQRSAQFEPTLSTDGWLYYANVACVVGCGQIIQEIWRMHRVSRLAEQVTLTNAISREPVVSADAKRVYFSSNRAGHFHIWEYSHDTMLYRQLTQGQVVDTSPALGADGALYFVRQTRSGTEIHKINPDAESSTALPLPAGVIAARDLEIAL